MAWEASMTSATTAHAHRRLLEPTPRYDQPPTPWVTPDQAPILVVEPLTEREQNVLRHASSLLRTAEIASEMHISVKTVKTHLKTSAARWRPPAAARRSAEPASLS
jgi:DNA-binding NarL/FixJ family response regulator